MGFELLRREVIDKNLCCRCGSCAGICPRGNIVFTDTRGACLPQGSGNCPETCDLCGKVCPGGHFDLSPLRQISGLSFATGIGACLNISLLKAADKTLREMSTSGGAVTALLIAFLEKGLIDGVISIGPDPESPTGSAAKILSSAEEIKAHTQSRYCVCPLNQLMPKLEAGKKYALVGLPCMVDGLRNMMEVRESLRGQVVITLGLFCHSTMFYSATEKLLELYRPPVARSSVKNIRYREGKFPGGFAAHDGKGGATEIIPLPDYMQLFNRHSLNRCRLCIDHYSAFSDLAFADPFPFLDELAENDQKWTVAIVRTAAGQKFVNEVLGNDDHVVSKKVTERNIARLNDKLRAIQSVHLKQVAMTKQIGLPAPGYNIPLPRSTLPRAVVNLFRVYLFGNIMLSCRQMLLKVCTLNQAGAAHTKLTKRYKSF